LKKLYPKQYLNSTYEIPFEKFYEDGYRGIIFDIDNTLVEHGFPANEKAIDLFTHLHELGFGTVVLSNNKEPRVKPFAEAVNTPYIFKAGKPSRGGYQRAMEIMGCNTSNTLFVGDQLFTDVWGANRTGLYSILVKPIDPREEIQIVLKRVLEKVILFFYKRGLFL